MCLTTKQLQIILLNVFVIGGLAFPFLPENEEEECVFDNCLDEFNDNIQNSEPFLVCLYVDVAKFCYDQETQDCDIPFISSKLFFDELNKHSEKNNCSTTETTPTPTTETPTGPTNETTTNETTTTEPPTPMDCQPQLLSLPGNSNQVVVEDLSMAVTNPKDSLNNPLCGRHEYPTLRHCSLFTHSHLRPFHADDIRTCMLPGTWYLLNHRDVTIQVTGVNDDIQSSYTRIDKIEVTLKSSCTSGTTINYVATATDGLSTSYTSDNPANVILLKPIDFHCDKNKTVATILVPWLNLTIIIRHQGDLLSIVLRMPTDLSDNADGLCVTDCPAYTQNNISDFFSESCFHDFNSALFGCSINAGLFQITPEIAPNFPDIRDSFVEKCQFDVLQSVSYSPLSLIKAIANDYKLLEDVAPYITPQPFDTDDVPTMEPSPNNTIIDFEQSTQTSQTTSSLRATASEEITTSSVRATVSKETTEVTTSKVPSVSTRVPISTNIPILNNGTDNPSSSNPQVHRLSYFMCIISLSIFLLFRM